MAADSSAPPDDTSDTAIEDHPYKHTESSSEDFSKPLNVQTGSESKPIIIGDGPDLSPAPLEPRKKESPFIGKSSCPIFPPQLQQSKAAANIPQLHHPVATQSHSESSSERPSSSVAGNQPMYKFGSTTLPEGLAVFAPALPPTTTIGSALTFAPTSPATRRMRDQQKPALPTKLARRLAHRNTPTSAIKVPQTIVQPTAFATPIARNSVCESNSISAPPVAAMPGPSRPPVNLKGVQERHALYTSVAKSRSSASSSSSHKPHIISSITNETPAEFMSHDHALRLKCWLDGMLSREERGIFDITSAFILAHKTILHERCRSSEETVIDMNMYYDQRLRMRAVYYASCAITTACYNKLSFAEIAVQLFLLASTLQKWISECSYWMLEGKL